MFHVTGVDPDSIRAGSLTSVRVDAMVLYYHERYGGMKGFGDSSRVYLCVGDTGVRMAGGVSNIKRNLRIEYKQE